MSSFGDGTTVSKFDSVLQKVHRMLKGLINLLVRFQVGVVAGRMHGAHANEDHHEQGS